MNYFALPPWQVHKNFVYSSMSLEKKTILVKRDSHPLQDSVEEKMAKARVKSLMFERQEIRRLNKKLGR